MKMSIIFFVLFAVINCSLSGMQFSKADDEFDYWIKQFANKTREELLLIAKDENIRGNAALTILSNRAILEKGPDILSGSVKSSNNPKINPDSSWIDNEYFIHAVGITAVLAVFWTTVEACIAYKKINKEEWEQANGFANKSALIAAKTGSAMHQDLAKQLHLPKMLLIKLCLIVSRILINRADLNSCY